jgi:hypothetical protein
MVAGVIPATVALLMEGVLKAMLLSKFTMATVTLLLVGLVFGAAGAIYQAQAAEQPREVRSSKTMPEVSTPQKVRPAAAATQREYVIMSRLVEAGTDQPTEVLRLP